MGGQKPWRSRLQRDEEEEEGGWVLVLMMGALARWMLAELRERERENERDGGRSRNGGMVDERGWNCD